LEQKNWLPVQTTYHGRYGRETRLWVLMSIKIVFGRRRMFAVANPNPNVDNRTNFLVRNFKDFVHPARHCVSLWKA